MRSLTHLAAGGVSPRIAACAIVYLSASLVAAAEEDIITVRMDGHAEGVGREAREAAIANAEMEVLIAVLKSMVASGDLAALNPILRNAPRYIRNYDMLRNDAVDEKTSVEIDAHVLERPLQQDVAALMLPRLVRPPRVLLLLGEKIGEDRIVAVPDSGVAETALREGVAKLGLEVTGSEVVSAYYTQAQLIEAVQGDVESAGAFVRGTLYDVVVIGTAITEPETTPDGFTVVRNRATVSLRVFRGADGKMVDALSAKAAVHGVELTDTGEQAVADACAKLIGDVTVACVIAVLGVRPDDYVLFILANPGARDGLQALVDAIRAFPEVSQVEELLYTPQLARYRIAYRGPMPPLVDFLRRQPCGGSKLMIKTVVAREITADCG